MPATDQVHFTSSFSIECHRTPVVLREDTASPYARQSIGALRESLPNPTLVVLERQEHNAMDGGRDLLADAIIKFAATQE